MSALGSQSRPRAPERGSGSLAAQWAALHDAGDAVAALAGVESGSAAQPIRRFPVAIRDAQDWQRKLAQNGIADISAILQAGLSALLAVKARGLEANAAALTLWQEFCASRDAVLALAPQEGSLGPRRSA